MAEANLVPVTIPARDTKYLDRPKPVPRARAGIRIKYVEQWVDKRRGGAKARFYFRRGGRRVALPGLPGSAQFMSAYEAALVGQTEPVDTNRVKAGSIDALVTAYYASAKFQARPTSTQRTYRGIIEPWRREFGRFPVTILERRDIERMLARRAEKAPASANFWLRLVKMLMKFAVQSGMRSGNPASDIEPIEVRSEGFHTWSEQEIAQFEAHFPIGSKPRLALALLLYTGQRKSDVVRMGRKDVHGDMINVRQKKTGNAVSIPLHPELARVMAATPTAIAPTFLMSARGRPFTADAFGEWFRSRIDEAELPKECSAHGLRKAACRRLAEAGCSANVIAAISGHASLSEVAKYTRAADQQRMARMGMAALVAGAAIK